MTTPQGGRNFERTVANDLRNDGYLVVKAGGSLGFADLIAIKPGQILLINVKYDPRRVSPAERVDLTTAADLNDVTLPIVAHHKDRVAAPQYRILRGVRANEWEPFLTDEVAAA